AQAAREAERGQEADEAGGQGRHSPGGLPRGAADGHGQRRLTGFMADATCKKSTLREYFESIVIAVILAFFVRTFVVQAFKIPSGSMEPNLLIGDHLLVNKFVAAPTLTKVEDTLLPIETIRRGDIIVLKHPKMPERDLIKRTIGLPGETIELRDRRVYVNGRPLDEPYAHFLFKDLAHVPAGDVRRNFGPVTIPDGQYFMMGDNRDN